MKACGLVFRAPKGFFWAGKYYLFLINRETFFIRKRGWRAIYPHPKTFFQKNYPARLQKEDVQK